MRHFKLLNAILFLCPLLGWSQINKEDSLSLATVMVEFRESIIDKDSSRFNQLFFMPKVNFTGIMSKESEWSIKKDYPDFQGIAVSDHKSFIRDICLSAKKQEEKFFEVKLSSDGNIASIDFDYAFYSDNKIFQWGHEKWNLVKENQKWYISDVIYSIHFPKVEPFELDQGNSE